MVNKYARYVYFGGNDLNAPDYFPCRLVPYGCNANIFTPCVFYVLISKLVIVN